MRILSAAPAEALDPETRAPRIGSYEGSLRSFELTGHGPTGLARLAIEKRWAYVAIASEAHFVATAVVDLGYAIKAFAFVYSRVAHSLRVARSVLLPPGMGRVSQTDSAQLEAWARGPGGRFVVHHGRGSRWMRLEVEARGLSLDAHLDVGAAPPSITAIAPVEGGVLNVTEKKVLVPAHGTLVVRGATHRLEGSTAGYDVTFGLLARRTRWHWAFLLGKTTDGEPVALNLVQGFVGEPECAVWLGRTLHAVGEGRFEHDAENPLRPWRIRTTDGAVDLELDPGAVHAEKVDARVLASRFVQPIGEYRGVLRVGGREVRLERVVGVAEDQDVLW